MPTKVTVVPATPDDAAAIASLGRRTFTTTFGWHTTPEKLQTYMDGVYTTEHMFRALQPDTNNQFFIALVDDVDVDNENANGDDSGEQPPRRRRVAGFVQMRTGTTDACLPRAVPATELHRIYVDLDHIGSGVGKALLEHGVAWAAECMCGPGTSTTAARVEEQGKEGEGEGEGRGRALVWLGVYSEQPKAQDFYRRRGFVKVGEKEFDVAGQVDIDWVMVRWIA